MLGVLPLRLSLLAHSITAYSPPKVGEPDPDQMTNIKQSEVDPVDCDSFTIARQLFCYYLERVGVVRWLDLLFQYLCVYSHWWWMKQLNNSRFDKYLWTLDLYSLLSKNLWCLNWRFLSRQILIYINGFSISSMCCEIPPLSCGAWLAGINFTFQMAS